MDARFRRTLLLAAVLLVGPASRGLAWQLLADYRAAEALAIDAAGDLVVGGGQVVKLGASDGALRWRWSRSGVAVVHAVRIDGAGDVYVAGDEDLYPPSRFLVAKLSGATGAELWAYVAPGLESPIGARRLALDAAGDVVVGGVVVIAGPVMVSRTVKLSGATGAELWQAGFPDQRFLDLAVDGAGDVLVTHADPPLTDGFVSKLSGVDGTVVWSHGPDVPAFAVALDAAGDAVLATTHYAGRQVWKRRGSDGAVLWSQPDASGLAVAVDAAGDVVAAGTHPTIGGSAATVFKLSGGTGAVLWEVQYGGTANGEQFSAITFDAAGHVVVAGAPGFELAPNYTYTDMGVVVLSPADGTELWRRMLYRRRAFLSVNFASAVGVDLADRVVTVGGLLADQSSGYIPDHIDFAVASLGAAAPGKRLLVKDRAGAPADRRLVFQASGAELVVGTPGGPADPTAAGATLELFNPTTAETATIDLPAAGWSAVGTESYVYSDTGQALGPCTRGKLSGRREAKFGTRGGTLSFTCLGAQLSFTLDEPAQGTLGVRFRSGPVEQCFVFGGTVGTDRPATTGTGLFKASDAPAPDTCP